MSGKCPGDHLPVASSPSQSPPAPESCTDPDNLEGSLINQRTVCVDRQECTGGSWHLRWEVVGASAWIFWVATPFYAAAPHAQGSITAFKLLSKKSVQVDAVLHCSGEGGAGSPVNKQGLWLQANLGLRRARLHNWVNAIVALIQGRLVEKIRSAASLSVDLLPP